MQPCRKWGYVVWICASSSSSSLGLLPHHMHGGRLSIWVCVVFAVVSGSCSGTRETVSEGCKFSCRFHVEEGVVCSVLCAKQHPLNKMYSHLPVLRNYFVQSAYMYT